MSKINTINAELEAYLEDAEDIKSSIKGIARGKQIEYGGQPILNVLGNINNYTCDANATATDILPTKTAYVGNVKITGQMLSYNGATTITPDTTGQTLSTAGKYNSSDITIDPIPSQYKDTTGTDAMAGDILDGKTAVNTTGKITGTIPTYHVSGSTTPTTSQQVLATGNKYVDGDITINAIPSNYIDPSNTTAEATDVLPGKYFYTSAGNYVEGQMEIYDSLEPAVISTNGTVASSNKYFLHDITVNVPPTVIGEIIQAEVAEDESIMVGDFITLIDTDLNIVRRYNSVTDTNLRFGLALTGGTSGDTITVSLSYPSYLIDNNLSDCTTNNESVYIRKYSSYQATITPDEEFSLTDAAVTIRMNGVDITNEPGVYTLNQDDTATIYIPSVTGELIITVVCGEYDSLMVEDDDGQTVYLEDADGSVLISAPEFNGLETADMYRITTTITGPTTHESYVRVNNDLIDYTYDIVNKDLLEVANTSPTEYLEATDQGMGIYTFNDINHNAYRLDLYNSVIYDSNDNIAAELQMGEEYKYFELDNTTYIIRFGNVFINRTTGAYHLMTMSAYGDVVLDDGITYHMVIDGTPYEYYPAIRTDYTKTRWANLEADRIVEVNDGVLTIDDTQLEDNKMYRLYIPASVEAIDSTCAQTLLTNTNSFIELYFKGSISPVTFSNSTLFACINFIDEEEYSPEYQVIWPIKYDVQTNIINGNMNVYGYGELWGFINQNETIDLIIQPYSRYSLPTYVSVSGVDTDSYNPSTGILTISGPNTTVTIDAECPSTPSVFYNINYSITNGSADPSSPTTIAENSTTQLTIIPDSDYALPADVSDFTVVNASKNSYDNTTGVLEITNIGYSGDVTVTASCPALVNYIINATGCSVDIPTTGTTGSTLRIQANAYGYNTLQNVFTDDPNVSISTSPEGDIYISGITQNITINIICDQSALGAPLM